ncbi:alpha/beta fold hydrolase [Devosia sp.]|uniref:alpha/beta fold hydrolase n=1 Tax=Devosia sp. TaxID=1871048 RepID=UPI0032640250
MTPILLVPGLLCTAEIFVPQIVALWPYGPVTVASTLEGETMAAIAANILAGAPPRFALAGISMGGYVCLEIMRQAPERVVKLALLDTSARPDTPEQSQLRRDRMARARSEDFAALLAETMSMNLHPDHRNDPELGAISLRGGLAVGVEGMARQQNAIITRIDSRPSLGAIAVPTTVIVGDADPLTPPALAQEMAEAIAGAKLVVIAHCGHFSTCEQPEAVNRALVEWISD